MPFSFVDGGLGYVLSPDERVDQDAYGMLRNNALEHIVGVSYMQLDDRRELRYDTDGLHAARDYFAHHVFNRQQFVSLLMGAAEAFAEAEEYMLSAEAFSNSLDTAFVDDRLNLSLVYVPVVGYAGCSGARVFLRDVRRCLEPDRSTGDPAHLHAIDEALNDAENFSIEGFKKLLASFTLKPKRGGSSGLKAGQGFASANTNIRLAAVGAAADPANAAGAVSAVGNAREGDASAAPAQQGIPGGIPDGVAVPATGGAPAMFGGMAIPGMEGHPPDAILKRVNVLDGIDGLDFSGSYVEDDVLYLTLHYEFRNDFAMWNFRTVDVNQKRARSYGKRRARKGVIYLQGRMVER